MPGNKTIHPDILSAVAVCLLAAWSAPTFGQATGANALPHLSKRGNVTQLIVDGKPFIILGGQVGNRSGYPDRMARAWPKFKAYEANTVEFPVYWSVIEPAEGQFDFSVSD
jgi:hypothetical protein